MPLVKFVFKSQPKKKDFSFGDLDYKKSIANSMFYDLESSRMTDVSIPRLVCEDLKQVCQWMVMINALFNETMFNEILSF